MTARPTAMTPARTARAPRLRFIARCSQVVQRAGLPDAEQEDDHDDDRYGGQRGRERQVVRRAAVALDQVPQQLALAADDLYGDVVAEAQREREDRTREHRGEAERCDNRAERPPRRGTEIAGRLQQRV